MTILLNYISRRIKQINIEKNSFIMKTITILLPIFNETESFPLLKENIQQVIKDNSNYEWIILMINDGSTDNSLEKMKNLCQEDHHFHYIDLSRNYGKEIAIMAGIDYAVGDAIIIMDTIRYIRLKGKNDKNDYLHIINFKII